MAILGACPMVGTRQVQNNGFDTCLLKLYCKEKFKSGIPQAYWTPFWIKSGQLCNVTWLSVRGKKKTKFSVWKMCMYNFLTSCLIVFCGLGIQCTSCSTSLIYVWLLLVAWCYYYRPIWAHGLKLSLIWRKWERLEELLKVFAQDFATGWQTKKI